MLIKGRNKPGLKPDSPADRKQSAGEAQRRERKSPVLKVRENPAPAAVEPHLPEEAEPRRSVIKKGEGSFEPVALFPAGDEDAEDGNGRGPGAAVEPDLSPLSAEEESENLRITAQERLEDAKTRADQILSDARIKANKLIEQAKLYGRTAKADAQREGFSAGEQKAREQAVGEFKSLMEEARQTLRETREIRDELARRMEGGLAKLAVKIAEKIIAREVSLNPDVVTNLVRSQIEKIKDRDRVIIHVNPEDYSRVKDKKEIFARFAPQVKSLEFEADVRVSPGGCMVETDLGTVDASVSTQIEAVELAFSKESEEEEREIREFSGEAESADA